MESGDTDGLNATSFSKAKEKVKAPRARGQLKAKGLESPAKKAMDKEGIMATRLPLKAGARKEDGNRKEGKRAPTVDGKVARDGRTMEA